MSRLIKSDTLIHFLKQSDCCLASFSDQTFGLDAPHRLSLCLTLIWTLNSANTETQCVGETVNESISLGSLCAFMRYQCWEKWVRHILKSTKHIQFKWDFLACRPTLWVKGSWLWCLLHRVLFENMSFTFVFTLPLHSLRSWVFFFFLLSFNFRSSAN